MDVALRQMNADEIGMIAQVDRRETVEAEYIARRSPDGMALTLRREATDPPEEVGSWCIKDVDQRIAKWKPQVENGGLLLGAFDGQRLVGFSVLGPKLPDGSAELFALFVDADHRRSGVGSLLMKEVESRGKARGIRALFIASNSTSSAVQFYLKERCKVVVLADDTIVDPRRAGVVFGKEI